MKVRCFGSLNIDYVYQVEHFVKKGETIASSDLQVFCGGKGLNQALALAKAGCPVTFAGKLGEDGAFLLETLQEAGVDISLVKISEQVRTGNAIIQIDESGDNCIMLYGGANQTISKADVDEILQNFQAGDYLVLQNEISEISYIIEQAKQKQLIIVLNPSPINQALLTYPLNLVDILILNEHEGRALLATELDETESLLAALQTQYPHTKIVLTLGAAGSQYSDGELSIIQEAYQAQVRDTTAAGDSFSGFFLAALIKGEKPKQAMNLAAKAAAITVSRPGAAVSIPTLQEVLAAEFPHE